MGNAWVLLQGFAAGLRSRNDDIVAAVHDGEVGPVGLVSSRLSSPVRAGRTQRSHRLAMQKMSPVFSINRKGCLPVGVVCHS